MTAPRIPVTYYVAASLDGFIATIDDGLDWLRIYENEQEDYGYQDLLNRTDCLVMGHRTYRHCLSMSPASWPYEEYPCRVLTSWLPNEDSPLPDGVTFTDQSPDDLLATLTNQGHRHCWLVGGGETAGAFLRAGLIDEIVLTLVPVALGHGIPLFGQMQAFPATGFNLKNTKPYPTGLVQLQYEKDRG